jgi:hypothetical protein
MADFLLKLEVNRAQIAPVFQESIKRNKKILIRQQMAKIKSGCKPKRD